MRARDAVKQLAPLGGRVDQYLKIFATVSEAPSPIRPRRVSKARGPAKNTLILQPLARAWVNSPGGLDPSRFDASGCVHREWK